MFDETEPSVLNKEEFSNRIQLVSQNRNKIKATKKSNMSPLSVSELISPLFSTNLNDKKHCDESK